MIASWPLLLEILGNMCILITSFTICDVMNFENNLRFLIKLFSWMIKKLWKIIKYLQAEKSFENEINRIIHNFERACNCQILSQRIFFCEWTNSITFAATYICEPYILSSKFSIWVTPEVILSFLGHCFKGYSFFSSIIWPNNA